MCSLRYGQVPGLYQAILEPHQTSLLLMKHEEKTFTELLKTLVIRPFKHDHMASRGLRYSKLSGNCSHHPNASIEEPLPLSWPGHGTDGAKERKRQGLRMRNGRHSITGFSAYE